MCLLCHECMRILADYISEWKIILCSQRIGANASPAWRLDHEDPRHRLYIRPVDVHAALARAHADRAEYIRTRLPKCRRWSSAWPRGFAPTASACAGRRLGLTSLRAPQSGPAAAIASAIPREAARACLASRQVRAFFNRGRRRQLDLGACRPHPYRVSVGRTAAPRQCRKAAGEESPGSMDKRCRITSGGGPFGASLRDSATENRPPRLRSVLAAVRVKRCGKSAPRFRQRRRHGKPHREQDRIGAAREQIPGLSGPAVRVGCLTRRATGVPEEWPSRLAVHAARPYRTRLTGRLIRHNGGSAAKPPGPRQFAPRLRDSVSSPSQSRSEGYVFFYCRSKSCGLRLG